MTRPFSFRDDPAVPPFDDRAPVAVMDAQCAVCAWGAQVIHRLDRSGTVRICPAQSPLGAALLRHYGLRPEDPASWLFLENGLPYVDFDAVIQSGRRFGGWGRLAVAMAIVPKPMRAWMYSHLARRRYALFGSGDLCALPDPAFQKRLLK